MFRQDPWVVQVGNDAVDQLTKFNQRLADLARSATPHTIDGLLVTKADTVDDKVIFSVQLPTHCSLCARRQGQIP